MMTTMLSSASILVSLIRSGAVTVTVLMAYSLHIYQRETENKIWGWNIQEQDKVF